MVVRKNLMMSSSIFVLLTYYPTEVLPLALIEGHFTEII